MRGEAVVVETKIRTGTAPGNSPIFEWVPETVTDVLVSPGPRDDVTDAHRPDGTKVAWTLHFPKTFNKSLRGARIIVRGEAPRSVVGDPKPFSAANTPTRWHMPVELEGTDG